LIVAVFDERPHERPLIERNDAMYADQLQPVCDIELQAPVMRHVPRLVSQIGDQFRRGHVTRVGFLEHISLGGADHIVDDLDVFRCQRVCVVPFVYAHRIFQIDFQYESDGRIGGNRTDVERSNFGLAQETEIAYR